MKTIQERFVAGSKSIGRDATFWKVLNAALELDFKKGHLKWTMSDLSRKSAITRSLIYYHFGRSKMSILEQAVRLIGEEVIGLAPHRLELWQNGDWSSSVRLAREIVSQTPFLGNFYLLHRERPTEIGRELRSLETAYFKKLKGVFAGLPDEAHRAIFAVMFGLLFAPLVDDAAVHLALKGLKAITNSLPSQSQV
jgi:AcrR family transcriptional regulator